MIKSAKEPTAIICVDNQAVNGKHNEMLIFLCFAHTVASLLNSPCFFVKDALALFTCSRFFCTDAACFSFLA
ncbi:conserved protein of unknown function [Magnetospirillum sp. XM-1]|nr:conserved protein of unknown function [Magnetospirillum sp. XM-1]